MVMLPWRAEDNGHKEPLGAAMAAPGDNRARERPVWEPTKRLGGVLWDLLGNPLGDLCLQGGGAKQRACSESLPSGRGSNVPSSLSCHQALVPVPPCPGTSTASNPDANKTFGLHCGQIRLLKL